LREYTKHNEKYHSAAIAWSPLEGYDQVDPVTEIFNLSELFTVSVGWVKVGKHFKTSSRRGKTDFLNP
jgi:hypothetical protein